MKPPDPTEEHQKAIAALGDPEVQKIYTNGFYNGVTLSDMFVVLQNTGAPVAVIQMSFNTAKTLAAKLSEMISSFESKSGTAVLTMGEVRGFIAITEEEEEG